MNEFVPPPVTFPRRSENTGDAQPFVGETGGVQACCRPVGSPTNPEPVHVGTTGPVPPGVPGHADNGSSNNTTRWNTHLVIFPLRAG
jgi:hypothetical protein